MEDFWREHKEELDADFTRRLVAVAGTRHQALGVVCDSRQMSYDAISAIGAAEAALIRHLSKNAILQRHIRFDELTAHMLG